MYRKNPVTDKYINLEFAYLKELSLIDMKLRLIIMEISLNLEHTIKTELLRDFNETNEDGYRIVKDFFENNPNIIENIKMKKDNSYVKELADKLLNEDFAIWNVVELISLNELLKLYIFFYKEIGKYEEHIDTFYQMQAVRKLRNAAAHSNCIITCMGVSENKARYNKEVNAFLSSIETIDTITRNKYRKNQVLYDFITLLFLMNKIVKSEKLKYDMFKKVYCFFDKEILKHKEYFVKEQEITSKYQYIKKIIDNLCLNIL